MKKRLFIQTFWRRHLKEVTLKNKVDIVRLDPTPNDSNEKSSHVSYGFRAFEYREKLVYGHHKKEVISYSRLLHKVIFEIHPDDLSLLQGSYILGSEEKGWTLYFGSIEDLDYTNKMLLDLPKPFVPLFDDPEDEVKYEIALAKLKAKEAILAAKVKPFSPAFEPSRNDSHKIASIEENFRRILNKEASQLVTTTVLFDTYDEDDDRVVFKAGEKLSGETPVKRYARLALKMIDDYRLALIVANTEFLEEVAEFAEQFKAALEQLKRYEATLGVGIPQMTQHEIEEYLLNADHLKEEYKKDIQEHREARLTKEAESTETSEVTPTEGEE